MCYKPPGNYRLSRNKVAIKHNHSELQSPPQRGVIYTGTVHHFKKIFQSVTALRMANTTLPVEVWVNSFLLDPCKQVLETLLVNTRCRQFSNAIKGWASKFYALLYTSLDQVLFIDADNVAARDVNEIFDSKPFKDMGAVLWPDLWGYNCSRGAATVLGQYSFKPDIFTLYIHVVNDGHRAFRIAPICVMEGGIRRPTMGPAGQP